LRSRKTINDNWKAAHERRCAADPDYWRRRLEKQNQRRRERLANDPAYRERHRVDRTTAVARKRFNTQPLARVFHREIRAFYAVCPSGYEVDHIEPLFTVQGGAVVACGLHVPWNLQYLTHVDNARKANANASAGVGAWRKTWKN
jgi:hypothetical protein